MANKTDEYLAKIRKLNGLQNAIIDGITVDKRGMTAEFSLITDKAYTGAESQEAERITKEYLPEAFAAKVRIIKRVPDQEMLRKRIYEFMCKRFPAAAAFLKEEDVEVEMGKSGANFCFDIAAGEQSLFTSGKILDEVSAYLSSVYCGAFYGNVRVVEKAQEELPEMESEQEEDIPIAIRFFDIVDFKKLDGADVLPKKARYIADCDGVIEDLTVCGAITFIQEREYTKVNKTTGAEEKKTRFSLTLSDGTGNLRVTYFPKKATVEKVRELKTGDWVVLNGSNEAFNGSISYTARHINYGRQPDGFVPEPRKGLPVPAAYHTVFPEPYVDYTQSGFFDSLDKPNDLKQNTFVVFDLETTGLNNQPSMGTMDRIIELGAVKMEKGNIVEKFSSFVACPDKLPQNIVELTGITDADLVGAPTVDKVLADFYKFCDGCYLVGHNVQFDYRFVRYYGELSRYMFDQRQYDTMTLAQELLRGDVANYKLNTLADYYGVTFNHHRAFDDALATAKIFIQLIKKRKKLP
jgi:DNA polymerase III epsilon subunit family exonuclease